MGAGPDKKLYVDLAQNFPDNLPVRTGGTSRDHRADCRGTGGEDGDLQDYLVAEGIIWAAFWLYWLVVAFLTRSEVERRQPVFSRFFFLMLAVIILGTIISGQFWDRFLLGQFTDGNPVAVAAGIAITLLGLGFAVWARVHLGKNWSGSVTIKVDHRLVRTGPYRYVRNPIYTGILAGFAGTALVIGRGWAVYGLLILLAGFLIKIQEEEKVLLEKFGEEYLRYKREVKALIPFVV